jgi:integrase
VWNGPFIFHRAGARVGTGALKGAWDKARKRAGLEGRLIRDLRRTAARDLRRKGLSEGVIMKLCGWKTRAMFDRYNIFDEDDLARSVELAFNDKQAANGAAAEQEAKQVS